MERPRRTVEHGLADRFLSIYLPIRAADGGSSATYEMYEEAAPIEAAVDRRSRDVVLFVGAMALGPARRSCGSRSPGRRDSSPAEQAAAPAGRDGATPDGGPPPQRGAFLLARPQRVGLNVITPPDATVAYESPAVERVLGYGPRTEWDPRSNVVHPTIGTRVERLFAEVAGRPDAQTSAEFRVAPRRRRLALLEAVAKNLLDDPAVGGIVVNYRDITARKALEEQLRHQAFHDSLTGLANRALFIDRLEHALAAAARRRGSWPCCSSTSTTSRRSTTASATPRATSSSSGVADRLARALRAGDTVARLGGDEFAVLLEDVDDADAPVASPSGSSTALERAVRARRHELFVGASVGIAVAAARAHRRGLLRNADIAMYRAKATRQGPRRASSSRRCTPRRSSASRSGRPRAGARARTSRARTTSRSSTSRRARSSASRRCCAGTTPSAAWSRRRVHPARRGDRPDRRRSGRGSSSEACRAGAALATHAPGARP